MTCLRGVPGAEHGDEGLVGWTGWQWSRMGCLASVRCTAQRCALAVLVAGMVTGPDPRVGLSSGFCRRPGSSGCRGAGAHPWPGEHRTAPSLWVLLASRQEKSSGLNTDSPTFLG